MDALYFDDIWAFKLYNKFPLFRFHAYQARGMYNIFLMWTYN